MKAVLIIVFAIFAVSADATITSAISSTISSNSYAYEYQLNVDMQASSSYQTSDPFNPGTYVSINQTIDNGFLSPGGSYNEVDTEYTVTTNYHDYNQLELQPLIISGYATCPYGSFCYQQIGTHGAPISFAQGESYCIQSGTGFIKNGSLGCGLSATWNDIYGETVNESISKSITYADVIHFQTGGTDKKHLYMFGQNAFVPAYYNYNSSGQPDLKDDMYGYKSVGIVSTNSAAYENGKTALWLILPDNTDIDITPQYDVQISAADISWFNEDTKEGWQHMVNQEILDDSGQDLTQYNATNGFMANRANLEAVYGFYQKIYLEQPNNLLWPGLAKLAGADVYAGLSDAQHFVDSSFLQQTLIQMNIDIYNDLTWQFQAYRKIGLEEIEAVYASEPSALDYDTVQGWQEIDQGIKENNSSLIEEGNMQLVYREQNNVLANGYSTLSSMTGISWLLSEFSNSPVSPNQPTFSFANVVSGGNICDFNNRWQWITDPVLGIWNNWITLSPAQAQSIVSTPLTTRAALFAEFSVY